MDSEVRLPQCPICLFVLPWSRSRDSAGFNKRFAALPQQFSDIPPFRLRCLRIPAMLQPV